MLFDDALQVVRIYIYVSIWPCEKSSTVIYLTADQTTQLILQIQQLAGHAVE